MTAQLSAPRTVEELDAFFSTLRPGASASLYWVGGGRAGERPCWGGHEYGVFRSRRDLDFYDAAGPRWALSDKRGTLLQRHGLEHRLFSTRKAALAGLREAMAAEIGIARSAAPKVHLARRTRTSRGTVFYTSDNRWAIHSEPGAAKRWRLLPHEASSTGARAIMLRHHGVSELWFATRKAAVLGLQEMLDREHAQMHEPGPSPLARSVASVVGA